MLFFSKVINLAVVIAMSSPLQFPLDKLASHKLEAPKVQRNTTLRSGETFVPPPGVDIPDSLDWRDRNVVTEVKNQGQCSSAWAFSAAGSLEGQLANKTGHIFSLSEQNLVDCVSWEDGHSGCDGGNVEGAYDYFIHSGIEIEDDYPYEAEQDECHFEASKSVGNAKGYMVVESGNEEALKIAVATVGPISVVIDASEQSFQDYESGVYEDGNCSSDDLDHPVLLVGYGTENGIDYWLVKNSWGRDWGEAGYIKMARNQNNMCGIATDATFPTV